MSSDCRSLPCYRETQDRREAKLYPPTASLNTPRKMTAVKQIPERKVLIDSNHKSPSKPGKHPNSVIDIRSNKDDLNLRHALVSSFNPHDGRPRWLPTMLLYDEKGLQLFEDVCSCWAL